MFLMIWRMLWPSLMMLFKKPAGPLKMRLVIPIPRFESPGRPKMMVLRPGLKDLTKNWPLNTFLA